MRNCRLELATVIQPFREQQGLRARLTFNESADRVSLEKSRCSHSYPLTLQGVFNSSCRMLPRVGVSDTVSTCPRAQRSDA
jgi:hypothetical protein